MKANELHAKSVEELGSDLIGLCEEQFKLQMQKATGQLSQTHLLKRNKRDVARIKSVLNQKAGE